MEELSSKNNVILPIRDTLDIISGKWKLPVIHALISGAKRFSELQHEIRGITPRMLSKELKELEINELVVREVFDTAPVTVIYSLTDHAESLCSVVKALYDWGQKHRERILKMERIVQ